MKDSAIMAVVFLTVILAVIINKAGFLTIKASGSDTSSPVIQSTGDPLQDEINKDYPNAQRS